MGKNAGNTASRGGPLRRGLNAVLGVTLGRLLKWALIAAAVVAVVAVPALRLWYFENANPAADLTIEVTGGDKEVPVENASVYLKYVEEHVIKKDKKLELNVKTNREGVAHVAEIHQ